MMYVELRLLARGQSRRRDPLRRVLVSLTGQAREGHDGACPSSCASRRRDPLCRVLVSLTSLAREGHDGACPSSCASRRWDPLRRVLVSLTSLAREGHDGACPSCDAVVWSATASLHPKKGGEW